MKKALNANGLKREMGLFSATVLVIANMVGTGVFTTSGFMMAELGNPRALLFCWLCGGVFALCGALCYGELGTRFPRAGGEYVFLRESFGKPMGFLSGWISLIVGFSAPIAAAAIAFSSYLFRACAIPTGSEMIFSLNGIHLVSISPLNLVSISAIVLFSLIHYHSLHAGSRIQNGLTVFKIGLIVSFIVAGFSVGNGTVDHFFEAPVFSSFSVGKMAVSMIFVTFAFSGWNAAAYLGGEIKNPQRNIPLSLFAGTTVVICLYLLLNMVYIYAIPAREMSGVLEVGAKSAVFLFGGNISRFFSGAVSIGILSVLSAMIMTGPRVYYAMSTDGIFFKHFGKLHNRRNTPAFSIFLQAGIAVVMVVTASFDALLLYIGFTLSLCAMMTVIGLMKIRKTRHVDDQNYKTFGYPITPLLFIVGNLWIVFYSVQCRPVAAVSGVGTILLGGLFYVCFNGRSKGLLMHKKVVLDEQ